MTSIIEEDKGLLPSAVPVVVDLRHQRAEQLGEANEVTVRNLDNVDSARTQAPHSLFHVDGVLVDLIDVSEALIARLETARFVALVLDDDPLEEVWSEVVLVGHLNSIYVLEDKLNNNPR